MKFNSKNRTHRIMVWVSDEEKTLLETKTDYYNYKSTAAYIRDACIYEKVTKVDIKNSDKICDAYSNYAKEIKKVTREIRNLIKYATNLDDITIQTIKSLMLDVVNNQKKMIKLVTDKLDFDVWQEINREKQIGEQ